ncbi:MAG: hypothetical protein IPH72_32310 [Sandaracinaceae bacterium]|nr:hypothetical protein [Sandaracinaceae bacterium]
MRDYLTPAIRGLVTEELGRAKAESKLYSAPRIYDSLLSSQPLCFNLFGELALRLDLATELFRRRIPGLERVTRALRALARPRRRTLLHDNTAFDVLVEYTLRAGGRGFLGIEVKYSEDVRDKPAAMRPRYLEVAQQMGCFDVDAGGRDGVAPAAAVARPLAGGRAAAGSGEFHEGLAVVVYPRGNECAAACATYRGGAARGCALGRMGLEDLVADVQACSTEAWVTAVGERYLAEGVRE